MVTARIPINPGKKQLEEISEYNYVFPGLVGVLAVTNKFLEIQ